ncbi:hypothetical protein ACL9RL_18840 [Plantibacter sp. Mn2098]|uniref:hypothetical protein n=1 Tax=Plantibacter sp. Mn2098 TaxID=3395266 RepID=UPI003BC33C27
MSLICAAASLIPVEGFLGRSMLVVVPYLLVPAGGTAEAFAIAATVPRTASVEQGTLARADRGADDRT